jgi:DNA-binding NarL/FixJ family response regulator
MTIRLVLVDDQPLVRAGLAMLLDTEPGLSVVAEAGDGQAAVELVTALVPDVVVMDVRMPGLDGVRATELITAAGGPTRVLVLTSYHVDDTVYAALRAGASGFLLKDAAPADLVQAVRAVAGGGAWLDPAVARRLLDDFARRPDPRLPTPDGLRGLTTREREVLALVAYGLSNMEISRQLILGEATVKTHLGRVLAKLGLRDRSQAIVVAYRTGLVKA